MEFVVASVIGVSRKWSGEAGEVEGVVGYHFYLVFFVIVFVDESVVLCVRVVLGKRREYIVVCSVRVRIEDGGETASHAIASERRLNASRVFSESFCLDVRAEGFLDYLTRSFALAYPSRGARLDCANLSLENGVTAHRDESFDVRLDASRRRVFHFLLLEFFPAYVRTKCSLNDHARVRSQPHEEYELPSTLYSDDHRRFVLESHSRQETPRVSLHRQRRVRSPIKPYSCMLCNHPLRVISRFCSYIFQLSLVLSQRAHHFSLHSLLALFTHNRAERGKLVAREALLVVTFTRRSLVCHRCINCPALFVFHTVFFIRSFYERSLRPLVAYQMMISLQHFFFFFFVFFLFFGCKHRRPFLTKQAQFFVDRRSQVFFALVLRVRKR